MKGARFKILKALKKFARTDNCASSPRAVVRGRAKSFPRAISREVYPGPLKILRQRQPGPSVVMSKSGQDAFVTLPVESALHVGKMPLMNCCLSGLEIAPPK